MNFVRSSLSFAFFIQLVFWGMALPNEPFTKCKNDIECDASDTCEREKYPSRYAGCGDSGVCYCYDSANDYDGLTVAAFMDNTKCIPETQETPSQSNNCYIACNKKLSTVGIIKGSYLCEVVDTDVAGKTHGRCFCDYRLDRNVWQGCKSNTECAEDDQMMKICAGSAKCHKKNCECDTKGFEKSAKTTCMADFYCNAACEGTAGGHPGKICPSMTSGKKTCFCDYSVTLTGA